MAHTVPPAREPSFPTPIGSRWRARSAWGERPSAPPPRADRLRARDRCRSRKVVMTFEPRLIDPEPAATASVARAVGHLDEGYPRRRAAPWPCSASADRRRGRRGGSWPDRPEERPRTRVHRPRLRPSILPEQRTSWSSPVSSIFWGGAPGLPLPGPAPGDPQTRPTSWQPPHPNRLESAGETPRAALDRLATVAPRGPRS